MNTKVSKSAAPVFDASVLDLDAAWETDRISQGIREQVLRGLRRRGAVVGLSGGVDSSVTAALCVRALGPKKVLAVLMPERDSDNESLALGTRVAETLGIDSVTENIEPMLTAAGCYTRRDAFIRKIVPDFGPGWGCKIVLTSALENRGINFSSLVVESPDGERRKIRMPLDVYQGVMATANMKQRTRKQLEYYHADRLNYAVAGTPNRLEHDQGFFVKNGDGAADFKPIAHLYKSQVYTLAEHLGIPQEVRQREPTTDTWSLPQSQEEFYFALPYRQMDLCLYGLDHGIPDDAVAEAVGLTSDQIRLVWKDIEAKRRVADYLHKSPLLVDDRR